MSHNLRTMYEKYAQLQYYVNNLIDSHGVGRAPFGVPPANQTPGSNRSFATDLNKKRGLFRGRLMGKRVDFSSRTVITGDPNLAFDEVGLPREMCDTLTYPERVTLHNRDALERECAVPAVTHSTTRSIFSEDRRHRRELKHRTFSIEREGRLEFGQVVERRLRNRDIVLLNRQPTLHKPSIQAMYVRIHDLKTITFGMSRTTGFNADFDGDEVSLSLSLFL